MAGPPSGQRTVLDPTAAARMPVPVIRHMMMRCTLSGGLSVTIGLSRPKVTTQCVAAAPRPSERSQRADLSETTVPLPAPGLPVAAIMLFVGSSTAEADSAATDMTLITFPSGLAGASVSAVADAESSVSIIASIMREQEIETLPRAKAAALREARHEDIRTLPHACHHRRRHSPQRVYAVRRGGSDRTLCQRRLDRDPPQAGLCYMATRHYSIAKMSDVPGLTIRQGNAEAIRVQTH